MKYEKPALEEFELILEGSFLNSPSGPSRGDEDLDAGDID